MLTSNYTSDILGLKEVLVTKVEESSGIKHIYLQMYKRVHTCPQCHTETSLVHDYRWQMIKDIPAFGSQVRLHLRIRRFNSNETACEISRDKPSLFLRLPV